MENSNFVPKIFNMGLSLNLKMLRERSHYSVEDIAHYLRISPSNYSAFEEEKADDMTGDDLEKLADLYNVDAYDMLVCEPSQLSTSVIPAFRKKGEISDLNEIAQFQRIVRNYVMMSELLEK